MRKQTRTDLLWVIAALPLFPGIMLAFPAWFVLNAASRKGWIGGVPTTKYGQWYAKAAYRRTLVWAGAGLIWWSQFADPFHPSANQVALWLFVGFGWWFHFERQAGRRKRLGIATLDPGWARKLGIATGSDRQRTEMSHGEWTQFMSDMTPDGLPVTAERPDEKPDAYNTPSDDEWAAFERSIQSPPDNAR